VRLLKSAPAAAKLREMQDSFGSYNQQQMQQGQGMVRSMPQQLLPYGDAMAYASALRVLQQQEEYSPAALERTVEAIRADVRCHTPWDTGLGGSYVSTCMIPACLVLHLRWP